MAEVQKRRFSINAYFLFPALFLLAARPALSDTTVKYRCLYGEIEKMQEIVSSIDVELTYQHFAEGEAQVRQMKFVVNQPAVGLDGPQVSVFLGYPTLEQSFDDGMEVRKKYTVEGNSLAVALKGIAMDGHGLAIWAQVPTKKAKCMQR